MQVASPDVAWSFTELSDENVFRHRGAELVRLGFDQPRR